MTSPATTSQHPDAVREAARRIAGAVPDPEIPVLTIADLGVLRDVRVGPSGIEIDITPTYCGCPAMSMIATAFINKIHKKPTSSKWAEKKIAVHDQLSTM